MVDGNEGGKVKMMKDSDRLSVRRIRDTGSFLSTWSSPRDGADYATCLEIPTDYKHPSIYATGAR